MKHPKPLKIYTRKGDKGATTLIGGKKVPKHHPRIECYGTLDELNSVTGMLCDLKECTRYKKTLLSVQRCLFTMASGLAAGNDEIAAILPKITKRDISFIEKEIDIMSKGLPSLTKFIIPGGHIAVSWCHVCRTVCRRAERQIVMLASVEKIDVVIMAYVNRLSDYYFILGRRLSSDLGVAEKTWAPRKR